MKLKLLENGKLLLMNVSEEAWARINAERAKCVDSHGWYFGASLFDGACYVNVTDEEDKGEIVRLLKDLEEHCGLEYTPSAERLFAGWRDSAAAHDMIAAQNADLDEAKKRAKVLSRLLRDGCRGCGNLTLIRTGDDLNGYCQIDGDLLASVTVTALRDENGGGVFSTH